MHIIICVVCIVTFYGCVFFALIYLYYMTYIYMSYEGCVVLLADVSIEFRVSHILLSRCCRQRDRHHCFQTHNIPKYDGGQIYLNFVIVL